MMHTAIRDAIAAGTPNTTLSPTPNWADIVSAGDITPPQQMLGIDAPTTLRVTTSAMPAYVVVTVYVGTSSNMTTAKAYTIALGVQTTFVVQRGMWVGFAADDGGNGATGTIQVANVSNGTVILDTVNVTLSP